MLDLRAITGFEWDRGNLEKNRARHQVSIREAEELFLNEPKVLEDEKHSDREQRWLAFGHTDEGRLLACAFTMRETRLRVISIRPMSRRERKWYAEKNPIR
ncbi:MAG: BrnT family toxin [Verrucomicrobiota bacterium]|nr:BrnT family toxin [Verrucomicrobiota bacterium]